MWQEWVLGVLSTPMTGNIPVSGRREPLHLRRPSKRRAAHGVERFA